MITLGAKIQAERKKRNWTQAELAERCKLKQPAIARYERGENPSPKNLNKICMAFDLPVNFFTSSQKTGEQKEQLVEAINDWELRSLFKEIKNFPVEQQMTIVNLLRTYARLRKYEDTISNLQTN